MVTDKKDLEKALSQIDGSALDRIKSVLDTHIGVKDDESFVSDHRDPFFWRSNINDLLSEDVFEIDREGYSKETHPESRLFRSKGMTLLPDSEQGKALREVENYIKKDFQSCEHIHEICEEQKIAFNKENLVRKHTHKDELSKDIILFCGRKFRLRENYRAEYEMDTIEEFYIKALAVSIMAESDGNSEVAKEILDKGGMAIIKNLDQESVIDLMQELQVLALEEPEIENEGHVR